MQKDGPGEGFISSADLLRRTGLSRATLNNYIKMGMIRSPLIGKPVDPASHARQMGFFPDSVLDTIEKIRQFKTEGHLMEEIRLLLPREMGVAPVNPEAKFRKESFAERPPGDVAASAVVMSLPSRNEMNETTPGGTKAGICSGDIQVTIQDLGCPAYLINNNFEIDWINAEAEETIFSRKVRSMKLAETRSIFRLFIEMGFFPGKETYHPLVEYHMSLFGERFQKEALENLYPSVSRIDIGRLQDLYSHMEVHSSTQAGGIFVRLPGNTEKIYQTQTIRFREGTLCVYVPADHAMQGVAELLSQRGRLIHDLLRHRMPTLICFSVLVADLQDSVRICAELPPEEYFSLINEIWKCMEVSFKKYYGTYGKHTGDGMVYYFLKDRDSDYIMNSLNCAMELRESMNNLSYEWKRRKGWSNELSLNIGINEGEEYFGTIPASPTIEFAALGDSVNYAGRLSDLARNGSIWTTKNLINRLNEEGKKKVRYGICRPGAEGNVPIENVFSRVMELVPPDNPRSLKFADIATLPVTELLGFR